MGVVVGGGGIGVVGGGGIISSVFAGGILLGEVSQKYRTPPPRIPPDRHEMWQRRISRWGKRGRLRGNQGERERASKPVRL